MQNSSIETYIIDCRGGAVVARRAHNPKVVGSNPAPATKLLCPSSKCSGLIYTDIGVRQAVRHQDFDPAFVGSNPATPAKKGH